MTERWRVICADCVEAMGSLPEGSADLILADPPYGIRKAAWDVERAEYMDFSRRWLAAAERVLRDNGILYIWEGDIELTADLIRLLREETAFALLSFCIWDKGDTYRAKSWKRRSVDGASAPRRWFQAVEYCLHLVKGGGGAEWARTGLDRVYSNPACFAPIKAWYRAELARLGLTVRDVEAAYTERTGRRPYMLRHYFCDSQFEIPTREIWEAVYEPLGFSRTYSALRAEYEALRAEYEALRYTHICDEDARNVWRCPTVGSADRDRRHVCQKPVPLLRRLIRVSSRPGDVVLDPFCGSGSAGVAALREGRRFIGIERDPETARGAEEWIGSEGAQIGLEEDE